MEMVYAIAGSIAGTLVVSLVACYLWSRLGKGKDHQEAMEVAKQERATWKTSCVEYWRQSKRQTSRIEPRNQSFGY